MRPPAKPKAKKLRRPRLTAKVIEGLNYVCNDAEVHLDERVGGYAEGTTNRNDDLEYEALWYLEALIAWYEKKRLLRTRDPEK